VCREGNLVKNAKPRKVFRLVRRQYHDMDLSRSLAVNLQ
jgi:hypothetical protein